MKLCHELGKQLHETMGWHGPVTHRQMKTWQAWFRAELDRPSRTDNYLMQIASEVRRGWVKEPSSVDANSFRIAFKDDKRSETTTEEDQKMAEKVSKGRWLAAIKGAASKPMGER